MSDDLDEHLVAADHVMDARRLIHVIEMTVRHNLPGDRDAEALAHVAYLAACSLEKAEAMLDAMERRP